MQIVILAAGNGKRMGDITQKVPKPMIKLKGKPILEHKINALPKEINEVILVIGHLGNQIVDHFKDNFGGKKITYFFQEKLDGTGGALHLAKDTLKEKFLVMMGDDLYHRSDIEKMLKHELAVLAHELNDTSRFGVLDIDKQGHVVDIIEKPENSENNLVNTGLYAMNKNFFEYNLIALQNGEFGLPQTLVKMSDKHDIKFEKATLWHPIGFPEDLEKAEKILDKFI
jgi:UDP-N-acetylglucosamine diphosphorylase / glucose-1-phosphate thymidylyltransferase / UDP-N-acetylgalactosamine diphosphorylase / glucosamine-1-phosphate N-acetyltransferase / galactosamine-1-phosphate N-acetyltransferase